MQVFFLFLEMIKQGCVYLLIENEVIIEQEYENIFYLCTLSENVKCICTETGRKTSLFFAVGLNIFYFYRHCTFILFILQCQRVQNNC